MRKNFSFGLLVMFIVATACTPDKTAVVNNDALIDSLNAACAAAWNSGNPETAANFYAEDAIITFQDNATFSGRDSILAFCRNVVPYMKDIKIDRGTYAVVNDLITETGLYTFNWQGNDQKIYVNRGSYIIYMKKTPENKWTAIMQVNHQANAVPK